MCKLHLEEDFKIMNEVSFSEIIISWLKTATFH